MRGAERVVRILFHQIGRFLKRRSPTSISALPPAAVSHSGVAAARHTDYNGAGMAVIERAIAGGALHGVLLSLC